MDDKQKSKKYKNLTIREFTKAADVYESGHMLQQLSSLSEPTEFFDSVQRVLRPGGRLILQDYTAPGPILWLMNHTEMPLANLIGHGDVGAYSLDEVRGFCRKSALHA